MVKQMCLLAGMVCVVNVHASQVATTAQVKTALASSWIVQRIEEPALLRNSDLDQSKKLDSKLSLPKPRQQVKKQGKAFVFAAPLPSKEIVEPAAPTHKNHSISLEIARLIDEKITQEKHEEEVKTQDENGQKQ